MKNCFKDWSRSRELVVNKDVFCMFCSDTNSSKQVKNWYILLIQMYVTDIILIFLTCMTCDRKTQEVKFYKEIMHIDTPKAPFFVADRRYDTTSLS